MPNRKKRLEKGRGSIEKAIAEHEHKRAHAISEGDEGLSEYYNKELEGMKDQLKRKKKIIDK